MKAPIPYQETDHNATKVTSKLHTGMREHQTMKKIQSQSTVHVFLYIQS